MGAGRQWVGREIPPGSSGLLEESLDRLFQSGPPAGSQEGSIHTLEVGCGDGYASGIVLRRLVHRFGRSASRFCTLDLGMDKVAEAARRLRGEPLPHPWVLRGDMYGLPFPSAGFDFLVALNVVFWAERQKLLAEAARVLKPGGFLLTCDAIPRPDGANKPLITMLLSREQLLARPAG